MPGRRSERRGGRRAQGGPRWSPTDLPVVEGSDLARPEMRSPASRDRDDVPLYVDRSARRDVNGTSGCALVRARTLMRGISDIFTRFAPHFEESIVRRRSRLLRASVETRHTHAVPLTKLLCVIDGRR